MNRITSYGTESFNVSGTIKGIHLIVRQLALANNTAQTPPDLRKLRIELQDELPKQRISPMNWVTLSAACVGSFSDYNDKLKHKETILTAHGVSTKQENFYSYYVGFPPLKIKGNSGKFLAELQSGFFGANTDNTGSHIEVVFDHCHDDGSECTYIIGKAVPANSSFEEKFAHCLSMCLLDTARTTVSPSNQAIANVNVSGSFSRRNCSGLAAHVAAISENTGELSSSSFGVPYLLHNGSNGEDLVVSLTLNNTNATDLWVGAIIRELTRETIEAGQKNQKRILNRALARSSRNNTK